MVMPRLQEIDFTGLRRARLQSDAGAFYFRTPRVENENRNVLFDSGQDGGGMQNFGAEVGHLRGFSKGNAFYAVAAGDDARVGGEHAVDVGPDLNFFGVDAGPDDGGRVVGAAAAQSGGVAVFG